MDTELLSLMSLGHAQKENSKYQKNVKYKSFKH